DRRSEDEDRSVSQCAWDVDAAFRDKSVHPARSTRSTDEAAAACVDRPLRVGHDPRLRATRTPQARPARAKDPGPARDALPLMLDRLRSAFGPVGNPVVCVYRMTLYRVL